MHLINFEMYLPLKGQVELSKIVQQKLFIKRPKFHMQIFMCKISYAKCYVQNVMCKMLCAKPRTCEF